MKTRNLEMVACKGLNNVLVWSQQHLQHWSDPLESSHGHYSCLLTMQLLLIITGVRRAKRKKSFRLKEMWRDVDGEGDPPCRLHPWLGWESGLTDVSTADCSRTEWKAPQIMLNGIMLLVWLQERLSRGTTYLFTFSSLFLNTQNSNTAYIIHPTNTYLVE